MEVGFGHGGLGLPRIFSTRKTLRLYQSSCVKLVADETDYVLSGLGEIDMRVSLEHRDCRIDRVPQLSILKFDVRMTHGKRPNFLASFDSTLCPASSV